MKKRFTDVEKWCDLWYRRLPVAYKLLWGFLCDQSDAAGVWKVDTEAASFYIGAKVDAAEALRLFNEDKRRVALLGADRWVLPDFIGFQYGELSKDCRAHTSVFSALQKNGLTLLKGCRGVDIPAEAAAEEPAPAAPGAPALHKEAEKAPSRPTEARKPAPAASPLPEWIDPALWEAFKEMRSKLRRPITDAAQALIIKKLEALRSEGNPANSVLEQSIANSWQGVFPIRDRQRGAGAAAPVTGKYSEVRRISAGNEENKL